MKLAAAPADAAQESIASRPGGGPESRSRVCFRPADPAPRQGGGGARSAGAPVRDGPGPACAPPETAPLLHPRRPALAQPSFREASLKRFPNPLVLLFIGVVLAAAMTWVLPAGRYDRQADPATGRQVVVSGSYHAVAPDPVGPFETIVALPRGMEAAGDVIFLVFLVGGAFTVIDRTGAFHGGFDRLVRVLGRHELLVIPIACYVFGAAGALENMQEEFIALVPVLLLLTSRLGFDTVVAVAISLGAASVGAAFSPINPFQVGIAQKIAGVPLLDHAAFRSAFLLVALALWSWGTARYARRTRTAPGVPPSGPLEEDEAASRAPGRQLREEPGHVPGAAASTPGVAPHEVRMTGAHALILALAVLAFGIYVVGVMRLDWGFNEMSALFLLLGVVAGLVGRLGVSGTAEAFIEGFRAMAFAAILIGFARAIFVVLDDGRVIDTIVHGLFQPIQGLPPALAAIGMVAVHTAVHVPVPSVSGQAVLTMPILAPLADLLGLSRDVAILAFQYGAGMCEILTPTNGALMAVLAAAGVRYERWLAFALRMWAMLVALGIASILVGIWIGM